MNQWLNDLWVFNPANPKANWTFLGGFASVTMQVYGFYNNGNPGGWPGARRFASTASTTNGLVYLFGGHGYASSGLPGTYNKTK